MVVSWAQLQVCSEALQGENHDNVEPHVHGSEKTARKQHAVSVGTLAHSYAKESGALPHCLVSDFLTHSRMDESAAKDGAAGVYLGSFPFRSRNSSLMVTGTNVAGTETVRDREYICSVYRVP